MGVDNILIENVFEGIWALFGFIYIGGTTLYNIFWTPLNEFLLGFIDEVSNDTAIGASLYDLVDNIISMLEVALPFPLDLPIFYYLLGAGLAFAVFYWLIIAFFKFLDLIIPI